MGILFALLALGSWGLGDFLIQRSTRKFGNWIALFYICGIGSVLLFPFAYQRILELGHNLGDILFLSLVALVSLAAALFAFEALRVGKISVVEPIYTLELPLTVLLAALFLKEYLSWEQLGLIGGLIVALLLLATNSFNSFKRIKWEKGVKLAIITAVLMGGVNFLYGVGAREIDPLVVNWFISIFVFLVSSGYLLIKKRTKEISAYWQKSKKLILGVSLIDNLAWVFFAYSTTYIPIGIATGISESYIGLSALLGLIISREKLKRNQWIGLALAVFIIIVLSFSAE